MADRIWHRQILLSAGILFGVVGGYRRQAYANCVSVGGSNFECSGVSTAQSISAANAHVTALGGFSVTTGSVNALTITGAGDVSYADTNASALTTTAAARTGLYVRANSGSPGSVTINTNGAVTGGSFGITGLNNGTGGALTVTANGDVTGSGATSRGIFTVNSASGTNLNVATGSGASVTGGLYGIFARNYGTGATSVTANGDVTTVGTSGVSGIIVRSDVGTTVTVTTGAGTAVTGRRYGIFARNGGSGALTVTTSGDVTGDLGSGIYARHAGGGSIVITVGSGSQVTSNGPSSSDAAIQTSSGPTTLTVAGTLNGAAGRAVRFDQFSAFADRLELQPTAVVTGTVLAGAGTDTLVFGGAGAASFDVATIGAGLQYQSFETFQKEGASTWTLTGTNTGISSFTVNGGTLTVTGNMTSTVFTVSAGTLQGSSTSLQANIINNAVVVFDQAVAGTYAGSMSGTGSLTKQGAGTLTLSSINSYSGDTTVSAGRLAVNGSLAGGVTVGVGGTLGGTGRVGSTTINAGGTVAPGNSIGTLTVNGSFTQNAGSTYQVEVNAAGQSDRINVVGAPGTATINGGTVQVLAQPGTYARNTTYTILNATGGVSGAYSNVTSNFAFLTPTLSYDANNVYLLLFQSSTAFAAGAQTANQRAVGTALDQASPTATGDFNTVLNALATLSTQQGPAALTAISGQQYSGFGTANVSGGLMFMNVLGQQLSLARGGSGGGTRVALAEACDVACDGADPRPWSLWGSALGGIGSVAGSNNSAKLTYNAGGVSTGVDYRFSPNLLAGLSVGYSSGNQWANGLNGRGTSDSYSGALYGSFTQSAFYLDALAGYAYNDNQMTRTIVIPGLTPRTAMGRTGANQFLGQAEAGYRFGIYEPAAASITPFARFQAMTITQNAFSESGANSLNLNVAQQTTNSVRTVLGAELAGGIDMGWRERLALQFRLGWAHEYADTSRPVTASFAGAPTIGYTVFGASPVRNTATVGLAASTAVADATSIYLRYDGEFGTGSDNHVLSAGFRMSW